MDDWEQHRKAVRLDLIRLKSKARTMGMEDFIDEALGLIEREKVRELERFKERVLGPGVRREHVGRN